MASSHRRFDSPGGGYSYERDVTASASARGNEKLLPRSDAALQSARVSRLLSSPVPPSYEAAYRIHELSGSASRMRGRDAPPDAASGLSDVASDARLGTGSRMRGESPLRVAAGRADDMIRLQARLYATADELKRLKKREGSRRRPSSSRRLEPAVGLSDGEASLEDDSHYHLRSSSGRRSHSHRPVSSSRPYDGGSAPSHLQPPVSTGRDESLVGELLKKLSEAEQRLRDLQEKDVERRITEVELRARLQNADADVSGMRAKLDALKVRAA